MEIDLPPELPEITVSYYKKHFASEPVSRDYLCTRVQDYVKNVAARSDAFHDLELCEVLAKTICTLAGIAPDDKLQYVQAAAYYLLQEYDADRDDSPIGFEDDRLVVNAVALMLGREDLIVEI